MYLARVVRVAFVLVLHSWMYKDTESLRDNAFSHIAKVNLQYGVYRDGGRFYQIDMKLPNVHTKKRVARAATSEESRLWPNAVVPYVIANSIAKRMEHLKLLQGAMHEWQKKTCLKFKKRTIERDFVEFYYGEGCNSDVGVMGTGRQTTSLGKGCEDHGIMVHEIGHLIGLYHEQNRPDRDKFVTIKLENVFPRYHYAFEKKDPEDTDSRNVPYDFYSVMHYGSTDFSKNKKKTIVSKVEGITEFGNSKISNLDSKVVNLMYKCPELIKFPRDFYWKHYGILRRDKDCIHVNEPEDPYSWSNNYLCRRPGKTHIGLEWSHDGPIEGMACIKAEAPSMEGKFGWNNNYFCWPKDSVYKFTWLTKVPEKSRKHHCLKIYDPRDRFWTRNNYYLCGEKDESAVDGKWSDWSEWTRCSRQCGGGFRRRVRTCNNPPPSYGGRSCPGEVYMTGRCGMKSCEEWPIFPDDFVYKVFPIPPIDLACIRTYERFDYFKWANHLFCTPDNKKDPLFDWSDGGPKPDMKCVRIFNPIETKIRRNTWDNNYLCAPKDVPYNFKFSRKGPIKGMSCLRWFPKPNRGWDNSYLCSEGVDKNKVIKEPKPINGAWSSWNTWSECTKSCSGGVQKRFRSCTSPKPQAGGEPCSGSDTEERQCNVQGCTVDGKWSYWDTWSKCTKSCGGGEQQRRRTCTNPAPQNGGKQCEGADIIRRRCNELPCAIDGGWSPWTWWGRCSKTCGRGIQLRSRSCTNPKPRDGGRMCPGKHAEIRACNSGQCPIDGAWSQWLGWSACSKSCSGGIQIRKRTCSSPAPQFGGRRCLGRSKEEQRCNTTPCPIDGDWSKWSVWKACSKTCGGGIQDRMRTCSNPIPRYGGKRCLGKAYEEQGCQTQPCPLPPVNGGWSQWLSWKPCTKTCAGGIQQRIRTCTNPTPQNGGSKCLGNSYQERRCNNGACPRLAIDGKWSSWYTWKACSKSCGGGIQQRMRSCTNPRPENGGKYCNGRSFQTRQCNKTPCRIDGRWALWSQWRACSKSCGGGRQRRMRSCTNPKPANGGRKCRGRAYQTRRCNRIPCRVRVDGKWSLWSQWRTCSKSCGDGIQQRMRSCTNPTPANGGRNCQGLLFETRGCNTQSCRIDGKWTLWSSWKACSRLCGRGLQQRTRSCTNPSPTNGGRNCNGKTIEKRPCNTQPCKVDGKWTLWSGWKACSKSCSGGTQQRMRSCTNPKPANGGKNCEGRRYQTRRCNRKPCKVDGKWSLWTQWRACSKSCSGGVQQRMRSCTNPKPANGGKNCEGRRYQTRRCNTKPCKVDGKWTFWSSWKACNRRCGGGLQLRTRSCTNPSPTNGGRNCNGKTIEKRPCNTQSCKVDGKWTLWSSWKACSRLCGGGTQQRTRSCTNPSPTNGGRNCNGKTIEMRPCNTQPCRVDGRWSAWKPWASCTVSCGGGKQRRGRTCSNPSPRNGGRSCRGFSYEERRCNIQSCRKLGWSDWSTWGACSASCGGGLQERRRSCTGRCQGRNTETQRCNTFNCRLECGGILTGKRGRITSPGYPQHYPDNIECTWIIRVPENLQVKLKFRFFYMENGASCLNDYVEVRDGSKDAVVLGKYCGAAKPEIMWSSGSEMWVRFHSNNRHNYKGFEASWRAIDSETVGATSAGNIDVHNRLYDSGISDDTCGGHIRSNYGRITSPGFPAKYPPNLDCEWVVFASSGRVIQFYFEYIYIDNTGHCGRDFVSLKDGSSRSSPSLGRYCGRRAPVTKTTSSNSFSVRFRSDGASQSTGFSLKWTSYYKYRASNPARRDLKERKGMVRTNTGGVLFQPRNYDCPHGWVSHNIDDNLYCYTLRKHYHSWLKAYVKCRQFGAELLTITSPSEQEFIRYRVQKENYVWIGLSDFRNEGNWTWENKTPLSYTNWATGEPNNGQSYWNEHCALMKPNGKWNDFPCDFQFSYICKMRKL